MTDPFSLRYFGPNQHADWCDGDPTHVGFCLDVFIRSVKEAPMSADQTWTTEQLKEDFEVLGFQAPHVVVKRRSDGQMGSLEFTHQPRLYFGWTAHTD